MRDVRGRLAEVTCPRSQRTGIALVFGSLPSQFCVLSISLGRFLNKGESWKVSQSGEGWGGDGQGFEALCFFLAPAGEEGIMVMGVTPSFLSR